MDEPREKNLERAIESLGRRIGIAVGAEIGIRLGALIGEEIGARVAFPAAQASDDLANLDSNDIVNAIASIVEGSCPPKPDISTTSVTEGRCPPKGDNEEDAPSIISFQKIDPPGAE